MKATPPRPPFGDLGIEADLPGYGAPLAGPVPTLSPATSRSLSPVPRARERMARSRRDPWARTARRRRPCSWAVRVFGVVNFGYMRPPFVRPMFPLGRKHSRERVVFRSVGRSTPSAIRRSPAGAEIPPCLPLAGAEMPLVLGAWGRLWGTFLACGEGDAASGRVADRG